MDAGPDEDMTESTIADFVGRFSLGSRKKEELIQGRIVMSDERVVFATKEHKRSIDIGAIQDIVVRQPTSTTDLIDATVAISYAGDDHERSAVIQAEPESITEFVPLLFRTILEGSSIRVTHPTQAGGHVKNPDPREGTLELDDGTLHVSTDEGSVSLDRSNVIRVDRTKRRNGDEPTSVLSIQHTRDELSMVSELEAGSARLLHLLDRYLQLGYRGTLGEAKEATIANEEIEALIWIYSGGDVEAMAETVDVEDGSAMLETLEKKDLLARDGGEYTVTKKGLVVLFDRDDVVEI